MARRDKWADLPTEEMFDAEEFRQEKPKAKSPRSVRMGNCPHCSRNPVGIVLQGTHYVWRSHTYRTWGGATMPCAASYVALCNAPDKHEVGRTAVKCPHDQQR
jgi:hypothetical protein